LRRFEYYHFGVTRVCEGAREPRAKYVFRARSQRTVSPWRNAVKWRAARGCLSREAGEASEAGPRTLRHWVGPRPSGGPADDKRGRRWKVVGSGRVSATQTARNTTTWAGWASGPSARQTTADAKGVARRAGQGPAYSRRTTSRSPSTGSEADVTRVEKSALGPKVARRAADKSLESMYATLRLAAREDTRRCG